jgi:hypothetical protein
VRDEITDGVPADVAHLLTLDTEVIRCDGLHVVVLHVLELMIESEGEEDCIQTIYHGCQIVLAIRGQECLRLVEGHGNAFQEKNFYGILQALPHAGYEAAHRFTFHFLLHFRFRLRFTLLHLLYILWLEYCFPFI